ncbi:transposon protein [Musa troglodytarum]|uniref:Transposon protein n=1 Tax=Musa troglodytarum TaxID=320322 RepID=A0A9E7JNK1_9LILI|nr:transposon protein [Musa troglodytarum]
MKCKSHPNEYGVGVCASCLRERLLAVIDAQNELSADRYHVRRRPDLSPLRHPLEFHRPVSPYISHRRSVGSDSSPGHLRQRFFSTPQMGPTFAAASRRERLEEIDGGRRHRFSIFRTLFGHNRSDAAEPGLRAPKDSASGSWFSALIRGRRKKKKTTQLSSGAEEEAEAPPWRVRRSCRPVGRGMSPAMEDEDKDHRSGYFSDDWRRPTPMPMRRFPATHRDHRSVSSVSGFSVCLSPLVSFGPESRRSHPAEAVFSGDLRSPADSIHHRNAAVLAPNRSRKLADLGRLK